MEIFWQLKIERHPLKQYTENILKLLISSGNVIKIRIYYTPHRFNISVWNLRSHLPTLFKKNSSLTSESMFNNTHILCKPSYNVVVF